MTQEQNTAEKITKLTTEQVAEFLRITPEFFESNLDLLSEIQVPHISGEGTTSLIERQVQVLREQNEVLKDQLKTFALLASENEEIWIRFKDLAVMLLTQRDTTNLKSQIEVWLQQEYKLAGVRITIQDQAQLLKNFDTDDVFKKVFINNEIHCDSGYSTELLAEVFAENAEKVNSCALIPLKNENGRCHGLLALGSENTERFSSQQSTAYLDCLSQLISQALITV